MKKQCTYMKKSYEFGYKVRTQCDKPVAEDGEFCNRHKPENRKVRARCEKCGWENVYGRTAFENHVKYCRQCFGQMRKLIHFKDGE